MGDGDIRRASVQCGFGIARRNFDFALSSSSQSCVHRAPPTNRMQSTQQWGSLKLPSNRTNRHAAAQFGRMRDQARRLQQRTLAALGVGCMQKITFCDPHTLRRMNLPFKIQLGNCELKFSFSLMPTEAFGVRAVS